MDSHKRAFTQIKGQWSQRCLMERHALDVLATQVIDEASAKIKLSASDCACFYRPRFTGLAKYKF